MDRLDSIYYEAIMAASEGEVNPASLRELHQQAAKFRVLDMRQDSARFYERIYQIWRTLKETPAGAEQLLRLSAFFNGVMTEYEELLKSMGRGVRAEQVRADLEPDAAGT